MVGAWCFGYCQAYRGLPVGFLLLRISALCTVESLTLLYLTIISLFLCSRRWYMDKLGSFMQTKHLCVLIHIWSKGEVGAPWNRFKPTSYILYWPFQGSASFVDHLCYLCLVFVVLSYSSVYLPCVRPLVGGGGLLARLWCLSVCLSFSQVVSWVKCGT